MGCPRIEWYHYASSLSQLSKINMSEGQAPAWIAIEKNLVKPFSMQAFLTQTGGDIPYSIRQNQLEKSSSDMQHEPPKGSSIWHNKSLRIDKKSIMWEHWVKSGIMLMEDMFDGKHLLSFEQLVSRYNITRKDFWKFLQIRSCIKGVDGKINIAPITCIQEVWRLSLKFPGGTSRFYNMLRKHQAPNYEGVRLTWEKDFETSINEHTWKKTVQSWYSIARDMQTRLMAFKIMNRNFWTPSKMSRLGLREDEVCWRCKKERGTLVHMLYGCVMVCDFWSAIVN